MFKHSSNVSVSNKNSSLKSANFYNTWTVIMFVCYLLRGVNLIYGSGAFTPPYVIFMILNVFILARCIGLAMALKKKVANGETEDTQKVDIAYPTQMNFMPTQPNNMFAAPVNVGQSVYFVDNTVQPMPPQMVYTTPYYVANQ